MQVYIVKGMGTVFHLNPHCKAAPGKLVGVIGKEAQHTGIKRICLKCRKEAWMKPRKQIYSTYP